MATKPVKPAAAPNIPTPVPLRTDPANFAARGDAVMTALPGAIAGVNAIANFVDLSSDFVDGRAIDAAASAALATTNGAAQVALAATQAGNALTSANNADLSEAAALTSANAAGLSADASEASRIAASKLNLGNKAAAPTLDNQGAALLAGTTYYDTTLSKWRVWTGSAWGDGVSAIAGVASVNSLTGAVTGIATTAANTFTAAQEFANGAAIASAATINLDTSTGNRVHITGTVAITAVTLTRGPRTVIFDGILTLTHHATNNNLPGAANITTAAGDRAIYESDGTTVRCIAYTKASGLPVVAASASVGDHEVVVHTGNGHGSTNTKIRRFTTAMTNVGTAITYADSATNGASFTVNEDGIYAVAYSDSNNSGFTYAGASVNSSTLTTDINGIAVSAVVLMGFGQTSDLTSATSVVRLSIGGVIRPHNGASLPNNTFSSAKFSIRKVGV